MQAAYDRHTCQQPMFHPRGQSIRVVEYDTSGVNAKEEVKQCRISFRERRSECGPIEDLICE